jgi:hypothetical protein
MLGLLNSIMANSKEIPTWKHSSYVTMVVGKKPTTFLKTENDVVVRVKTPAPNKEVLMALV